MPSINFILHPSNKIHRHSPVATLNVVLSQNLSLPFVLFQVSSMKCGLLAMSKEAILLGDICYYDYTGSALEEDERDRITRTLGPHRKVGK